MVSGIAMGFIYCLIAIEQSLIWNSCGICNFAHERFITMAAFFFGGLIINNGLTPAQSILATMGFLILYGILCATMIFVPLREHSSVFFTVMGAVTLSFFMKEIIRLIWGPLGFSIPGFLTGYIRVKGISFSVVYFYIIGISILLLIVQKLFFTYTKLGRAIRAVQQDRTAAKLMGINVTFAMAFSIAASSAICALVGILVIPLFSVGHNMSSLIALKGFAAGVIGGFGSYMGAIVGGLTIGILESTYCFFGPTVYKDIVSFVLMILFLIVKPNGIAVKKAMGAGRIKRRKTSTVVIDRGAGK